MARPRELCGEVAGEVALQGGGDRVGDGQVVAGGEALHLDDTAGHDETDDLRHQQRSAAVGVVGADALGDVRVLPAAPDRAARGDGHRRGGMPVTLSIITTTFPPDERGRAVGVWVGVAGGGAVLGLIPLARTAPRIADRFGINEVVALGLTLSASGMVMMTTLEVELVYWRLAVGLVLFAAGMALAGTRRRPPSSPRCHRRSRAWAPR